MSQLAHRTPGRHAQPAHRRPPAIAMGAKVPRPCPRGPKPAPSPAPPPPKK